jgi:hypothetical protein
MTEGRQGNFWISLLQTSLIRTPKHDNMINLSVIPHRPGHRSCISHRPLSLSPNQPYRTHTWSFTCVNPQIV